MSAVQSHKLRIKERDIMGDETQIQIRFTAPSWMKKRMGVIAKRKGISESEVCRRALEKAFTEQDLLAALTKYLNDEG